MINQLTHPASQFYSKKINTNKKYKYKQETQIQAPNTYTITTLHEQLPDNQWTHSACISSIQPQTTNTNTNNKQKYRQQIQIQLRQSMNSPRIR